MIINRYTHTHTQSSTTFEYSKPGTFSHHMSMLDSCFNKEDDINNEVEKEPDDPDRVVSKIMHPHPVWDAFDSSSTAGFMVWLKPISSTIT